MKRLGKNNYQLRKGFKIGGWLLAILAAGSRTMMILAISK